MARTDCIYSLHGSSCVLLPLQAGETAMTTDLTEEQRDQVLQASKVL